VDTSLPSGEIVDVIVLLPTSPAVARRSAVEVLAEAPGQRLFKTAADVAAYLREERDAWER
jgi:transposase